MQSIPNEAIPRGCKAPVDSPEGNPKEKKETNKEKIHTVIFDFWNSLEIIKHLKLSAKTRSEINSVLKVFTQEEIFSAMNNYKEVLSSDKYLWSKKWILKDFLSNVDRFLDEANPLENYLSYKNTSPGKGAKADDRPQTH